MYFYPAAKKVIPSLILVNFKGRPLVCYLFIGIVSNYGGSFSYLENEHKAGAKVDLLQLDALDVDWPSDILLHRRQLH